MTKVIAIKLPDDVYEELEKRAKSEGYTFVAEYAKSLLVGFVKGKVEKPVPEDLASTVERMVREMLSKETLVDLNSIAEQVSARIERKLQDEIINPYTAKIDSLAQRLGEIQARLELVEEKITSEQPARRAPAPQPVSKPRITRRATRQPARLQASGISRRKTASERLREQGAVYEEDVGWLRNKDAFFDKLAREGAIVLSLPTGRIAVDPDFWARFLDKLGEIASPRDEEVKVLLEPRQYKLFAKLRSAGKVYFDETAGSWRVAESSP